MAAGDLGNGLGYIYVTETDGTTIVKNIINDAEGARLAKALGVEAAAIALNRRAIGSIRITAAPTGNGSVTAISVNGVNQISSSFSYTVATTVDDMVTNLVSKMNSFAPATGYDYTAIGVGDYIYILAPVSAGSTPNGYTVAMTVTTNPPTYTTSNMANGSSNTNVYDDLSGYRFFLNANYDANGCSCDDGAAQPGTLTNAEEITDYIVNRGLQSALPTQALTISSGKITVSRKAFITVVTVDTESSAASDNLDSIVPSSDFANGDMIILRGVDSGRVVTITSSGNIDTNGAYITAGVDAMITLMYVDGTFYETGRSGFGAPSATLMRASLFPLLKSASYGNLDSAVADNTTTTLTANTSKQFVTLTGTVSLSTGNYTLALSTTDAIAGDEFFIKSTAIVTVGSYAMTIAGVTLTAQEALSGGVYVHSYYDGSAWQSVLFHTKGYQNVTADIKDANVTTAKLETNLRVEEITRSASFETNEVGDMKTKIYYPGTISEVYFTVDKAVAATDDGTIDVKDNGGASMGVITVTASAAIGTVYTLTPSSNNTVSANDTITATTAKTTKGGFGTLVYKITRS